MNFSTNSRSSRVRGVALVMTMALVILLSFMVIAFFSLVTTNRQIENASAGGVTAGLLAEGAIGAIQAELRQEIIAGSTVDNGVYYPKTPADMVPQRSLNFSPGNSDPFANLVKQSGKAPSTNAGIFNFAATHPTTTPASNGRVVSAARWDSPMLTGEKFTTDKTPRWIYVNPTGYSASPTAATMGRLAFNVFDIGGLLNINASGFAPGGGGTAFSSEMHRKGTTTWADLRILPGINPNSFASNDGWPVQWRITGDWGSGSSGFSIFSPSSAAYYERTGWRNAFLSDAGAGSDRIFASRQDLIRYAKTFPETFTPAGTLIPGLQYLTHWSRWKNAPTFRHDETRPYTKPVLGGVATGGNDYDNATSRKTANPFFPSVKVNVAFQRKTVDRTGKLIDRLGAAGQAKPGEPLVKYRFALTRLGLMTRTATGVDDKHPIYWAFGLTRGNNVSDPWIYSALKPSNSRIYNLDEVAALGREPNFFELLKAAIHAGSLGKASGDGSMVTRDAIDGNLDLQVWRIGANLIDQYDADSFPTIIRLPPGATSDDSNYVNSGTMKYKIYGIESLPQVQAVTQVWKWTSKKSTSATPLGGTLIMQPVLWNPHDITTYTDPGGGTPTKFKVWCSATSLQYNVVPSSTSNPDRTNSAVEFTANPTAFREPNLIAREGRDGINPVATGLLASLVDDTAFKWIGSGKTEPAGGLAIPGAVPDYAANSANGLSVYLDYQDTDGAWVTYSALENVNHNGFKNAYDGFVSYFAKPDPRTQRFGSFGAKRGATHPGLNGAGNWNYLGPAWPPTSGKMTSLWDLPPRGPVLGNLGQFKNRGESGNLNNPTAITQNNDSSALRYSDPDGVFRFGDSGFGANGLVTNEQSARPILLNRPFRSVGEMGYAFRDLPWKSIDFFSERSGDSALLDVFCISETPDDAIVANRVSLNSASGDVLKAMLNGGLRRDAGGSALSSEGVDLLSDNEVDAVTQAILTTRATSPFLNRAELVSRVMGALPASGSSFTIKRQREAAIRALADMVETNVWNVMIDVIAQSGRVRPGGSTAADFNVEGERRRWHFVSIDRFTAKVLDQHGEDFAE